jgi:hypothetical protein
MGIDLKHYEYFNNQKYINDYKPTKLFNNYIFKPISLKERIHIYKPMYKPIYRPAVFNTYKFSAVHPITLETCTLYLKANLANLSKSTNKVFFSTIPMHIQPLFKKGMEKQTKQNFIDNTLKHPIKFCVNCIITGLETIFEYTEQISFLGFIVLIAKLLDILNIAPENILTIYWIFSWHLSFISCIYSYLLDFFKFFSFINNYFNEDWYKAFIASKDISIYLLYYPETNTALYDLMRKYANQLLGKNTQIINNLIFSEYLINAVITLPQIIFLLVLLTIFFSVVLTFFNKNKERLIDNDYLINSITVESEKEISPVEDTKLIIIVITFVFGWFFLWNSWSIATNQAELYTVFLFLPTLLWIVIMTPTCILYDFGIIFTAYLKGSAVNASIFAELFYDYMATVIYYTRLLVQTVRLVLMYIAFAFLHDTIIYSSVPIPNTPKTFWTTINSIEPTVNSLSTFFFMKFLYF